MPSKSKGRAPAHQNRYAFRHNPKSKKTDKILSSPNVGVCKRCHEKIEWRKKYRKYKPRTQLGKCNMCQKRNIKAAYHTICGDCSYKVSGYEKNIKMCEICTKEPVFASTTTSLNGEVVVVEGEGGNEVDMIEKMKADLIHEKEEAENKAIRLRDKKSIDRKVQKLVFGGGGGSSGSHAQHDSDDDSEEENSDDDNEDVESSVEDLVEKGDNNYGDDDDEDEDPFLKAIGGKEKLLVGEAYQKMLLEKQKK